MIELRRYYRTAGRPPLRRVSQAIDRHSDPDISKVTASPETVRRMITGKVMPVERDRVRSVFIVFCELGGVDPEAPRWNDPGEDESNWQYLQRLWDEALEQGPARPHRARPQHVDPWSTDGDDDPPF